MRVLDFADDLGASLRRFLGSSSPEELPSHVKEATVLLPEEGRDRDFALILVDDDGTSHRKYACHDPGSTLVSMFYLDQAYRNGDLGPVATKVAAVNLTRLGEDWGLEVPVEIAKLAEIEVAASDCARDVVDERRVRYRPPIRWAAPVQPSVFEKAASVLHTWPDLPPAERRVVALALVKEAERLPLSIPPEVERYAGEGLSPRFAEHMRVRATYARDPEVAEAYGDLAKVAAAFEAPAVVQALYELDAAAGLRWSGGDRYGEKLADPVLCVFDRVKEAAFAWYQGGEHVTEHDLSKFRTRPDARRIFTETFTDDLWLRFVADPVGAFKGMNLVQQVLLSRMAREE